MSMTPMNNFDYLERVKFSEELAEIEAAKKASGMTYEELAEKIGVSRQTISKWESNQSSPDIQS